jgi:hypothetical protein
MGHLHHQVKVPIHMIKRGSKKFFVLGRNNLLTSAPLTQIPGYNTDPTNRQSIEHTIEPFTLLSSPKGLI